MAGEVRASMIRGAADLLALRGPGAATIPKVLELTGAPRGSIYHHFPRGREQLHALAIDLTSQRMHRVLQRMHGRAVTEVIDGYFAMWAAVVESSHFTAGCVVTAVTVAEESQALRAEAAQAFQSQQDQLTDLLTAGGMSIEKAESFATVLISGAEGAVLLCRARESSQPLTTVCQHLLVLAEGL